MADVACGRISHKYVWHPSSVCWCCSDFRSVSTAGVTSGGRTCLSRVLSIARGSSSKGERKLTPSERLMQSFAAQLAEEGSRALTTAAVVWGASRPPPPCPDCLCQPTLVCSRGEAPKEVLCDECPAAPFPWVIAAVCLQVGLLLGYLLARPVRRAPSPPPAVALSPPADSLEELAKQQAVRFRGTGLAARL